MGGNDNIERLSAAELGAQHNEPWCSPHASSSSARTGARSGPAGCSKKYKAVTVAHLPHQPVVLDAVRTWPWRHAQLDARGASTRTRACRRC